MIHINTIGEKHTAPDITKMPLDEFCGRAAENARGTIYEIALNPHLTVVMDEEQVLALTEALLDALPPQHDLPDSSSDGEAWKGSKA